MMPCRYCGEQRKLIKAHILPEAFFRRLREGDRAPLLVKQGGYVKRSPIGVYDDEILCADCEAIFGPWDDHAQNILSKDLENAVEVRHGNNLLAWTIATYDYELLKLFFISLLWRASVSPDPFYRRIKLGPFESIAKAMIEKRDPGDSDNFAVVLAHFTDSQGTPILDPHPSRLDGLRWNRFYLGGYVAYIKTDARRTADPWKKFSMTPGQPLYIVARDMQKSKELAIMREVVGSSIRKR